MKKLKICNLLLILFIFIITTTAYANQETNAEISIKLSNKEIDTTQESLELIISLEDLRNLSMTDEYLVMGYQAILEYDNEIFETATVEGLNGWNANYEKTTNTLIGDTADAKPNTDIAKIILKINKNAIEEGEGKIILKDMLLTDGTNDFQFNKELTVKVVNHKIENNDTNNNVNTNIENTQVNDIVDKASTKGKNSVTAVGITRLPAAGLNNIIIIAIVIVIIAAIIFKSKSKDIKY